VSFVACGGNPSTGPSTPAGPAHASADKQILVTTVNTAGVADIRTFDPGLSTDAFSITAIDMVFTGLVQLDNNGAPYDELAASHKLGSDGLTWTFTLRDNLKFSDGTPLTSTDVAYSIDRALQPAEKSITAPIYLSLVKDSDKLNSGKIKTIIGDSILTPDPKTVVIIANKKAAYFLEALTYSCSYVVEKSLFEKWGKSFADHLADGTGGGAGPWMVSKYVHGKEIDFVPNPNYYGPKPQLKKVIMPFYKVRDTAYRAYQTGQLDDSPVPSAQLASAKSLPNGQYHRVPQLWIAYYTMNYLVKPFDNIKIRQAFALALDKDLIAHNIYKDTVIATNHIVPNGMPGYNPDLTAPDGVKGTKGDAALAKKLFQQGLQEEGYANAAALPPITVTISSVGEADIRNEAAAEQQMWQTTLGVSVKINDIDFNQLLADIEAATNNPKGLQFWGIAWIADYPDPQDWTTLQFDKGVPNNQMNYGQNNSADAAQQQATQQLLEQADVNPDNASRMKQYNQAEQQLVNDVAWLPVYQVTVSLVRKPCVTGVIDNAEGLTPPKDWQRVYISTQTPCADTSSYQ
jgi:peptide/nickel transport system substrate-binding protein/oligopeptide transport system substrate-binding protein